MKTATVLRFRRHCRSGFAVWTMDLVEDGNPPTVKRVSDRGLLRLVRDGYTLEDPKHLINLHGPRQLRTDDNHVARDDRDSALGEP